ncbi:hypothetical protein FSP39_023976 [Pinctada imbricata]|uniref:G-protein coupled receptors family 1 profile domain-containing protein n=1 Tax=Pinctada imbricata TaxID=66713 RepID=A0AA88YH48_PINIB|nr:hypothetical protein FSP39_023976 [Pinctada imbricata]
MMSSCSSNRTTTQCSVGTINETMGPPIMQFLGGFVENVLALFILIKTKKNHKWKPFYRLVCALAITDATVSSLVYPFAITRYATRFTYCYSVNVCHHVAFILSFAFLGSALIVTAISFDRFLAILFPFKYDSSRKIQRTTVMIFSSWILTAAICTLPLVGVGEVKFYYPETWCFIDFTSKDSLNELKT